MTGGDGAATETASCMACGRELRDEESRRLRLGPVCRERLRGLLTPRPRRHGTPVALPHPAALPGRPSQLALELWDDEDEDDDDPDTSRTITDVPTGALL
ncbi:DUF6011 domain-containing protein [Streptomyces sediminimaris]|uniref:DUF6011 domain-containing protein n=1 Tax=Streptomyces sediminimaris TaxID=3383721 RepID=UPI003999F20B